MKQIFLLYLFDEYSTSDINLEHFQPQTVEKMWVLGDRQNTKREFAESALLLKYKLDDVWCLYSVVSRCWAVSPWFLVNVTKKVGSS